jgi:hypothetical protein
VKSREIMGFARWVRTGAICLLLLGLSRAEGLGQIGLPPIITVPPLDQTVPEHGTATFSVVAISLTQLHYQWYKDGSIIPGAKGTAYTITNASYIDVGEYSVKVSNSAGTVSSGSATLKVITLPLQFVSANMVSNGFSLQLAGPINSQYIILTSTNLSNWVRLSTNNAPNGVAEFIDRRGTNGGTRFYRAMVR